jgi:hypothetical protein
MPGSDIAHGGEPASSVLFECTTAAITESKGRLLEAVDLVVLIGRVAEIGCGNRSARQNVVVRQIDDLRSRGQPDTQRPRRIRCARRRGPVQHIGAIRPGLTAGADLGGEQSLWARWRSVQAACPGEGATRNGPRLLSSLLGLRPARLLCSGNLSSALWRHLALLPRDDGGLGGSAGSTLRSGSDQ